MHEFDEQPSRLGRLRIPLLATSAAVAIVGWLVFNPPSLFDGPVEEVRVPRDTGEIRVASLSESFDAEGTLEPELEWTVVHPSAGTITKITSSASPIATGSVLYRVDNVPTTAIVGSVPAYRTMTVDSVGTDVLQLEEALVELGYDSLNVLSIDQTYTTYTASLVELWQEDLGMDPTGTVDYGTVVFIPGNLAVGEVMLSTGDMASGGTLMTLESTDQMVRFDIDVTELHSLPVGSTVSVRLPDNSTFEAVVTDRVNAGSGLWTVHARPAEPLDQTTPVDVSWTVDLASDAVVVSAGAIRRLDNGTFVVEVVHSSDLDTEFVPVELGIQSGSSVELTSGPAVGTAVVEP
ncbi:MAG: efflux RND transporter periplasmic adaptor subunit [Acidimicrobiales bacterium]|nr:efflux RND transporter periplasmic adaptor subunit [Acidimicrobiales bacterium]